MRTSLLLFVLFISTAISATEPDYGLFIKSYPYKTSEFSNLVLEEGNSIQLNEEIVLTFDLYVREENVFGTIFRLITAKEENIDLLITAGVDDKRFPILVVNESIHSIQQEITRNQWIPISIALSPKDDLIKLNYGGEEVSVQYPVSKSKNFKAAFGICPFEGFTQTDVASVNIKDIRIVKKGKPFRHWKLEKHYQETCYDNLAGARAVALNPIWMIDQHMSWKKIFSMEIDQSPSITFNPNKDDFYIVNNSEKLIVFNAGTLERSEIPVRDGSYVANAPNQLLYIPQQNILLSYNMNEDLYSSFSFGSHTWSNRQPSTQEHSYWNNSTSYNPADRSLVSFGGYGFYRYNNELVRKYPFDNGVGNKVQLTDISPRYSSGTAIVNNTLYIVGGRGNRSGRQELFPKNYYDFYAVNLQTNQANKLWEVEQVEGGEFVPSENMIYDPDKKCFYVFTTQAGGTLMKVTTEAPGFEPMSLPVNDDIETQFLYSNLYYSPTLQKLLAVINKTDANNQAEITIYSLNCPPVIVSDMIQTTPISTANNNEQTVWIVAIVLIVLLLAVILIQTGKKFYNRSKKGQYSQAYPASTPTIDTKEQANPSIEPKKKEEKAEKTMSSCYDFSKQCICFLGGFHVRDKNGEDITSVFTPTLKALLILLILHTKENKRGISGNKMLQFLWSEKTESSARNSRNVYLSKLRTALEPIGRIDIVNDGGFWSIQLGKDVVCDYAEAMDYLKNVKDEELENETEYHKLLELLLRGTLLPNTEIDWIDRFKSDFSNLTIDTLNSLLVSRKDLSNSLKFRIAETLFQHDFINEDALHIKCMVLSESGKMGLAKSFYDSYCKDYYNLLGTKYKFSLSQVIDGENLNK